MSPFLTPQSTAKINKTYPIAYTSYGLKTKEILMDAWVAGDFWMERRGDDIALLQGDSVATGRGHHTRVWTDLGHERAADEHKREIGDLTARLSLRVERAYGFFRGERPELTPVRIAAHGGVERAEIHIGVVLESAGEQNHARARAEDRFAGGDVRGDRLK